MTHYSRGADFERVVKRDLERRHYLAYRSAGSHGAADLVALKDGFLPLLVQCKLDGKLGPGSRIELLAEARLGGALALMASRPKRGAIVYQIVSLAGISTEEYEP